MSLVKESRDRLRELKPGGVELGGGDREQEGEGWGRAHCQG